MASGSRGEAAEAAFLPSSSRQRPPKVVLCVLLAFTDSRRGLETEYQLQHSAARTGLDTLRALLRAVAWLGFTARAVRGARATAQLAALMLGTGLVESLAPVALLAACPHTFLRWRCIIVAVWNCVHVALTSAFYPQLYVLAPPPTPADTTPVLLAPGAGAGPAMRLAGQALWLLWHSQTLLMALNAGAPIAVSFRYLLYSQLLIFVFHLPRNPGHCAVHPQMQAAVASVHTRIIRPALSRLHSSVLLLLHAAPITPAPATPLSASAAAHLCSLYLPLMQLLLGLLLPCAFAYRTEWRQRRAFLEARGLGAEHTVLVGELGLALLAVALQLAVMLPLPKA